ncbi:MAG: type II toxin-antitoxin system PrlF family antitoxin [Pseudomonadota bacterium]
MASPTRSNSEQYNGKVTPVGNSKGIRLDAAFFKAHPEFNGDVRATVLADGQVLLSAKGTVRRPREDEDGDPVMLGFLQFLEKQMADHPDLIEPADRDQLARIGKLVEGVSTDDSKH